jgi:hypothetical protein
LYEAKRAFEQYNEVDPRNRLVAEELERRWNQKLEEAKVHQASLAEMDRRCRPITEGEEERILELGGRISEVWESDGCPAKLKRRIIRTAVEEVIVNLDETGRQLKLVIHWKGGSHTSFEMEQTRSGKGRATAMEDLELIRRMGACHGDDEIARVLNKLSRTTATSKAWTQMRVTATRKSYSIDGTPRVTPDPEILTLAGAAEYTNTSDTTIKRLVDAGLLKNEQIAPWAPWRIRRSDLDTEPVAGIVRRLRETGKLVLGGDTSGVQKRIFPDPQ